MSKICSWRAFRLACVFLATVPLSGCPSVAPSSPSQPAFAQDGNALRVSPRSYRVLAELSYHHADGGQT